MSALHTKIRARLSTKSKYGIALLIIFGIALALRVWLPYENVFMGDWVNFGGNDPWYHMRLVENLVQHFPHLIAFDPFTLFPYGQDAPFAPFFDLLLGFFIWVIGLGSPTQHTIETVGAYFPAILGALVTIPVYFIGRELFNRNVGLLSAALIAILPGQFLLRSLLGFTDHHIAEVLFSATAALFLILAIKRAKEKETSFSHIRSRDWGNLRKPLIYALLAGLALGIYLISWSGGLLFVFIIFVYMVIQYIIDHLRGKSTDYLCIIGVPMFLIALIIVIPFLNFLTLGGLIIASLTIGMLTLSVLSGISRLMDYGKLRRAYYILVLAGLALAALGIFYAVDPSLLSSMLGKFSIFTPSGAAVTIGEVQPALSITGFFRILYFFTVDIFLALIALGLIIRAQVKDGNAEKTFLVVWSILMLVAMLGQNRFAYYFAVNVALLAGYLCWRILVWSYLREAPPEREEAEKKEPGRPIRGYLSARYPWAVNVAIITGYLSSKIPEWLYFRRALPEGEKGERKEPGRPSIIGARRARVAGVAMMVFLIAILPNIVVAVDVASDTFGPNEAWHSSLVWMRDTDNTPDPFGDPDFYYELYDRPPAGERYDYPESAYGVMNFWDYGHWITRIAHRIPSANPFQAGAVETARFFTVQDESSANEVLDELDSKYVIIDYEMATGKFPAIPIWAGESQWLFFETYRQRTAEGELERIMLYYPEYYRSMCSRLYNFEGEAVVPHNSTLVISYEEKSTFLIGKYKEITSTESFATYEEALEYLESQTAPNYRIVGEDPFISPVPLEELEHYQLVHQSDPEILTRKKVEPISYVKIFEYLP
ncbi:MAG: hypothetical protein KAW13_02930 [Dehalococcoidia bacterium]|nr:hypothetical protein [Dehalococcoidia bacterium]